MKPTPLLAACGLLLAVHGAAPAQSGASLQERRLGIIKGTAPGITLVEAPRAASAASPAAPTAPAAKPAAPVPLSAARRLDSPALGITLPSAGPAASKAGDERRR